MKFEIKRRFTGAVKFTAEIEAQEDAPASVKLRLAVLWAIENKVDLRGSNLSGSDLSNCNLRGSDLRDCYLSNCNLRGSDLRDCYLSGSDLRGSDLRGSNLSSSDLRDCDLSDCNLRGSDLSDCDLSDCNLRGSDLRGSNLSGSNLSGSDLSNCNLRVLQTDIWTVYVQKDTIRIGCQYHSISDWGQFTDGQIANMHGRALIWWKIWKDIIFAIHATI